MVDAETPLLTAIYDLLVEQLTSIHEQQIAIEPDEDLHAIAADEHIILMPNGVVPGRVHATSGGVFDISISCRIVVFHRCAAVPRDRREHVFIDRSRGLNLRLGQIADILDFSNPLLTLATEKSNNTVRYVEPLRFAGMDPRPTMVNFVPYDAASTASMQGVTPIIAMKRGINFASCRAMEVK